MRIKSNFKDYYDGLAAADREAEPLFLRKTEEIRFKEYSTEGCRPPQIKGVYSTWKGAPTTYSLVTPGAWYFGFCGQLYPVVVLESDPTKFVFSLDEVKRQYIEGIVPVKRTTAPSRGLIYAIEIFFKLGGEVPKEFLEDHVSFVWLRDRVIINPRLASWDFQRIKSPYEAYRDIQTWLSNKAAPRKEIPKVSDKDMIVAKGFDLKSSFRREKRKDRSM